MKETQQKSPFLSSVREPAKFSHLSNQAFNHRLAFAMWQLPGQSQKHFIADLSAKVNQIRTDLDELPHGFVLGPYDNPELQRSIFIRADLHYQSGEATITIDPLINEDRNDVIKDFDLADTIGEPAKTQYYSGERLNLPDTTAEEYKKTVEHAVYQIKQGALQKVVLSKVMSIPLTESFDLIYNFFLVCETYKNAFVSIVSVPGIGTWMGASPDQTRTMMLRSGGNVDIFGTRRASMSPRLSSFWGDFDPAPDLSTVDLTLALTSNVIETTSAPIASLSAL